MTPERAKELLDSRSAFETLTTQAERRDVLQVWRRMPGSTLPDVLLAIANGIAPRKMIGTLVHMHPDMIIDQSPVYEGETINSPSVLERVYRSIMLLGMPATAPDGYHAKMARLPYSDRRFFPLGT